MARWHPHSYANLLCFIVFFVLFFGLYGVSDDDGDDGDYQLDAVGEFVSRDFKTKTHTDVQRIRSRTPETVVMENDGAALCA